MPLTADDLTDRLPRVAARLVEAQDEPAVLDAAVIGLVNDYRASLARIWIAGHPGRSRFRTLPISDDYVLRLKAEQAYDVDMSEERGKTVMAMPWITRIAVQGRPIQTSRLYHGGGTPDASWMRGNHFRTFAGYPLKGDGGCSGVLTVFSRLPFTDRAFDHLRVFSEQLNSTLKLVGRIKRAEEHEAVPRKARADLFQASGEVRSAPEEKGGTLVIPVDVSLDEAMRLYIETVLSLTNGRIEGPGGAAERLRIHPNTLRSRMDKLGVNRP